MKWFFYLAAVLMLLTACASAPKQQDGALEIEVPESWSAITMDSGDTDTLWWKGFQDDKLEAVLSEAFDNNYNLQIAGANVRAAFAQAKISGADLYPQLSLSGDGSRRKQNFIGLPITSSNDGAPSLPGFNDGVLTSTSTAYGISINLSWELDLWGRIRNQKSAALAEVQAVTADYRGAQLSLAAQVCKAWFAAVEAKRQVELAQATVDNLETSNNQVRRRYESGVTGSLDYRLSLSNLAQSRAILNLRKSVYDNTLRQLEILIGRYPSATLDHAGDLPVITESVPAGLPAVLISRRPDLVAAERRLAGSYANIKSAKAALYPRLSLTASGGTSSNQLSDLVDGDFSVWSVVGNILQPLFQGGRLRANVDLSKARADIALAQYGLAALNAFAEVESALSNEQFLSQRQANLEDATEQSLAARNLAEDQYARGLTDFITMLESQRSAYESESNLLAVRRERLDARIDLYLALGGGFEYPADFENE